jgi:hypothetical protein
VPPPAATASGPKPPEDGNDSDWNICDEDFESEEEEERTGRAKLCCPHVANLAAHVVRDVLFLVNKYFLRNPKTGCLLQTCFIRDDVQDDGPKLTHNFLGVETRNIQKPPTSYQYPQCVV